MIAATFDKLNLRRINIYLSDCVYPNKIRGTNSLEVPLASGRRKLVTGDFEIQAYQFSGSFYGTCIQL